MKYSLSIRVLHWLMAIILLGLVVAGFVMEDLEQPTKLQVIMLHKSLGVAIIILALIRLVARFTSKAPELPEAIPVSEQKLAKLGHLALYALFFIIPFSGYLMSNTKGYPVALFGIPLPWLAEKNEELGEFFEEAHEILAFVLIGLVVAHVAALILHRKKHNVDLLSRMR